MQVYRQLVTRGASFPRQRLWIYLEPFLTEDWQSFAELRRLARMTPIGLLDALSFGKMIGMVEYNAKWVRGEFQSMYRRRAKLYKGD